MIITWYGHSCFLVETDEGSVVFDPYEPGSVPGLTLPPLSADAVICSHGHGDHNYAEAVSILDAGRKLSFRQIPCKHDSVGGRLRGENRITAFTAENMRVAHLGDLGHLLTDAQRRELGEVDILMIPVGGFFTSDAGQAYETVSAIRPKIVIPMHYRKGSVGYKVIGKVDPFLKYFPKESIRFLETPSVEIKGMEDGQTVLVFPTPA